MTDRTQEYRPGAKNREGKTSADNGKVKEAIEGSHTGTENGKNKGKTMETGLSVWSGGLLWFGAAVSVAEIMTGTLLAPLGFGLGMAAILAGHVIGGWMMYLMGLIGAQRRGSAMETVGFAFGRRGSVFFAILNVLQLAGWTAVMIAGGADALRGVFGGFPAGFWALLIGGLIGLWVVAGLGHLGKINTVAAGLLLLLSLLLGYLVFNKGTPGMPDGTMRFGTGLELSIVMPISWLPLIADYTRQGRESRKLTFASTAGYFVGSVLMYAIGLGAALFAGTSDVVAILSGAGLGVAAILVVVIATVTTTFMDVFSAGESVRAIFPKISARWTALAVTLIGTAAALLIPTDRYEQFLYLIGSVFAPLAAIQATLWFVLKKKDADRVEKVINGFVWVAGFVAYRFFLTFETFIGSTIPAMLLVSVLCIATHAIRDRKGKTDD